MVFTECKQPLAGADTSLSTTMGPDTSEEPTYKKPVSGTLHSTSNATPSGEAGVPGQRLALTSLGSMPSPHSGWERQKIGGGVHNVSPLHTLHRPEEGNQCPRTTFWSRIPSQFSLCRSVHKLQQALFGNPN